MSKEQKITVSAINIRVHPHKPDIYLRLFKDAFSLKRPVQIRGNTHGLLNGTFPMRRGKAIEGIEGEISRFTHIDPTGHWLNTETYEPADEAARKAIVIPDNLKPNYVGFNYAFFPASHIFIVQTYSKGVSFSVSMAHKFLDNLFSVPEIQDEYGVVDLTVVPETDALSKIWKIRHIESLLIKIQRPNADDLDDAERAFLAAMNKEHVSELVEERKAIKGTSIAPSEGTKVLARIAERNGLVKAHGKDESGHPVDESTAEHPLSEPHYFDPDATNEAMFFQDVARRMNAMLKKMKKA